MPASASPRSCCCSRFPLRCLRSSRPGGGRNRQAWPWRSHYGRHPRVLLGRLRRSPRRALDRRGLAAVRGDRHRLAADHRPRLHDAVNFTMTRRSGLGLACVVDVRMDRRAVAGRHCGAVGDQPVRLSPAVRRHLVVRLEATSRSCHMLVLDFHSASTRSSGPWCLESRSWQGRPVPDEDPRLRRTKGCCCSAGAASAVTDMGG